MLRESFGSPLRDGCWRAVICSLVLFVTLLGVYVASPIRTAADSRWVLHEAASILRGQGANLKVYDQMLARHDYYGIAKRDGRLHSIFPIGAPLFAMPGVLAMWAFNPEFDKSLNAGVPERTQRDIASIIGAVAAGLFFWLAFLRFGKLGVAVLAALIFGLCTSMWSVATRTLWQHGPLILMLVTTMLLLQQARLRPALIQFAGISLALAYVTRPTAAIPIVVLTIYVLVVHRPWFPRFIAGAAVIAVLWFLYNLWAWGSLLPPYYLASRLDSPTFHEALLGHLISPGRGLFVFSSVLLFAFVGFVMAVRQQEQRGLYIAYGVIVVLHWIAVSRFPVWWAGYSFGPRFMIDIVPFLSFFVAFVLAWAIPTTSTWKGAVTAAVAVLAVASALIHAQGAIRTGPYFWIGAPTNIDRAPSRNWDWNDLQFLRRAPS